MTVTDATPQSARRKREISLGFVVVLGVIVVPALIVFATTRQGVAPDADAYVSMAFCVVAGLTIAIVTAVGALVAAVARRATATRIAVFAIIAVVTSSLAMSSINSQAEPLVRVLAN